MKNNFLNLFTLITYLIGFVLIILSNIYKNIYLAKVAMGFYVLFGLILIFAFWLKK
ncbi:hypothetical protein [Peptoniphilus sp. DNF00840]|uniref:hypothetical protein n=1 Tax=Peptoniphilus sp. DNF00840 TaxID=1477000 RepID=UPI00079141DA|nr:hypothetical protein [Peptoniphilus sp. DNF00840]KXB68351.1 hypothetical protein HMPREF1864_01700 [Peptoniphilus sp. DNF00840]